MSRPHIEFVQSQRLPWMNTSGDLRRPGVLSKRLSIDEETGASTEILRYLPGFLARGPRYLAVEEEIFVLSGTIVINGRVFEAHNYAFLPAGYVVEEMSVDAETDVLTMFSGTTVTHRGTPPAGMFDPALLIERLDPLDMAWDQSGQDPNLSDLLIWRKILRLDPRGKCRTFLLAGLAHGIHPARKKQLEYHTYCEEMLLLSGELAAHRGLMQAGAYFWRPPGKIHGLEASQSGFLALIRIPGSNENVSNWVAEEGPVSFAPDYRPILPEHLAEFRGNGPLELKGF